MNRLFLPLTVVLFVVAACGPRDVPVERSNGGFNNKGGNSGNKVDPKTTFTLTKKGQISKTCVKGEAFKILIAPETDIDGINDGTIQAVVEAGNRNCFQIGSTLDVKTDFGSDDVLSSVIVTKTEAIAISNLSEKHAEAFNMTVEELEERANEEVQKALNKEKGSFDAKGMVTITYFKISGNEEGNTETNEKETPELTTLVFSKKGEKPSTCSSKNPWKYISIPETQDENVKSGKVFGWIGAGEKNCFEIGSTILLQEKDGPVRAQLKVSRVEVVPLEQLSILHATSMGMVFVDFKEMVLELLESKPNAGNVIHMTFFEYVPVESTQAQ